MSDLVCKGREKDAKGQDCNEILKDNQKCESMLSKSGHACAVNSSGLCEKSIKLCYIDCDNKLYNNTPDGRCESIKGDKKTCENTTDSNLQPCYYEDDEDKCKTYDAFCITTQKKKTTPPVNGTVKRNNCEDEDEEESIIADYKDSLEKKAIKLENLIQRFNSKESKIFFISMGYLVFKIITMILAGYLSWYCGHENMLPIRLFKTVFCTILSEFYLLFFFINSILFKNKC
tara:strand:- start:35 stop:727 length:693 start_codon:yes stop_codon:yes gene_type:complete